MRCFPHTQHNMVTRKYLVLWTLLVGHAVSQQCPSTPPTGFKLSVGSRRNLTGHWMISVDAQRANLKQLSGQTGLDVELGHAASYCQGSESQHLTLQVAVANGAPPADYRPFAALGFYKTHAVAATWDEAKDTCEQEGAHLFVLDSERESDVIKEFFARKLNIANAAHQQYVHVGVHDRYNEGQYETVLGDPVPATGNPFWHSGQPDGGSENCCVCTVIGKYADAPCSWKLAYICEYNE